MNLQDTVRALETKDIVVALDIGVHGACALDSNCPLAIQLRKLIEDAGITLEQILEGYQEVTASDPVGLELPSFDATLSLTLGGRRIDVDYEEVISNTLKDRIAHKLRSLENLESTLKSLGNSLYHSYLEKIRELRDDQSLRQVSFPMRGILEQQCLITSINSTYLFLFPTIYYPQYTIKRGIRSKLSEGDTRTLKRSIYLEFKVSKGYSFLGVKVLTPKGHKFEHYHGNHRDDCWGAVSLPSKWDGTLDSLARLTRSFTRSLMTVNCDSLMDSEPTGMPHVDLLLEHSTELGREGEMTTPEVQPDERPAGWGTTRWGRRT